MAADIDLRRIFEGEVPLLDVRAEIEFEKGHFPSATNVPILTTGERHRVGRVYKDEGREAAIALGHELVRGKTKAQRVARWVAFADEHPHGFIHCWRGGMRSRLAAEWLKAEGRDLPTVPGGFKALRQEVLTVLEDASLFEGARVIGGRTGSNKTGLVRSVAGGLDLEELAHHRGSGFGKRALAQPAQVTFENRLAIAMLQTRRAHPSRPFVLEDEGKQIGSCRLPPSVFAPLHSGTIAVVVVPFDERVAHVRSEYVVKAREEFVAVHGDDGWAQHRAYLEKSLHRIRNRLGLERATRAKALMEAAFDLEATRTDPSGHDAWIALLLREYYDPKYDHQLAVRESQVTFEGSFDDVLAWARA